MSLNPFNGKIVPHALPWLSFKELQVGVKDDRRKFGQNHADAQFSLGQTEGDLAELSQEAGHTRVFPVQTRERSG